MAIQILPERSGIGRGISAGADALQGALETAGKRRYAEQQEEQQRQRQQQEQQQQIGALGQALQAAQSEEDPIAQMATFQNKLAETGVALPPDTALNYLKGLSVTQKAKTDPVEAAERRQTFKGNQTLIAGLASDARTAKGLYKDVNAISNAIEGGKLAGPGLTGEATKALRWLTGVGRPGDEQTLDTLRKNALIQLGDLKGLRLTDVKLKFLEESLFNPRKSLNENREALRIYKETLERKMSYPERVKELMKENPDALHDPTLPIRVSEFLEPDESSQAPPTFDEGTGASSGSLVGGLAPGKGTVQRSENTNNAAAFGFSPEELAAEVRKKKPRKGK